MSRSLRPQCHRRSVSIGIGLKRGPDVTQIADLYRRQRRKETLPNFFLLHNSRFSHQLAAGVRDDGVLDNDEGAEGAHAQRSV